MKKSLIICLALFTSYSSLLNASTINVISSNGLFAGNSAAQLTAVTELTDAQIANNLSDSNLATYLFGSNANSTVSADLTLQFENTVVNQTGADIAFYFMGGSTATNTMSICFTSNCDTINATIIDEFGVTFGGEPAVNYALSAITIDLSAFGYAEGEALDQFSIDLIAGGYNRLAGIDSLNTVSAVPLPAAAWLFITGLGALGIVSRRRA